MALMTHAVALQTQLTIVTQAIHTRDDTQIQATHIVLTIHTHALQNQEQGHHVQHCFFFSSFH